MAFQGINIGGVEMVLEREIIEEEIMFIFQGASVIERGQLKN
jgi:hypothetical protein